MPTPTSTAAPAATAPGQATLLAALAFAAAAFAGGVATGRVGRDAAVARASLGDHLGGAVVANGSSAPAGDDVTVARRLLALAVRIDPQKADAQAALATLTALAPSAGGEVAPLDARAERALDVRPDAPVRGPAEVPAAVSGALAPRAAHAPHRRRAPGRVGARRRPAAGPHRHRQSGSLRTCQTDACARRRRK